jgi:hypothetical protein
MLPAAAGHSNVPTCHPSPSNVPAHTAGCHTLLQEIVLESPYGDELPQRGFDAGEETFQAPPPSAQRAGVQVSVDPASSRLQLLEPFKKWDGDDIKVGRERAGWSAGCVVSQLSTPQTAGGRPEAADALRRLESPTCNLLHLHPAP